MVTFYGRNEVDRKHLSDKNAIPQNPTVDDGSQKMFIRP